MKVLVMSDSHGANNSMLAVVEKETPDYILHLGDYDRDCAAIRLAFPDIPLRAVRGNCDFGSNELEIDEFVLNGKRFLMTHGHLFGVKSSISRIKQHAENRDIDILLFGHTHVSHYEVCEGGLHVINPGSMCFGSSKSYAVIEISNEKIECELRR